MIFKIIFSIAFAILTILKLFFKFEIDNTTIILVLLIFLPWLIQELQEFELTGIGKFKLKDKEKENIKEDIKEIEKNVDNSSQNTNEKESFLDFDIEDPTFILAEMRINIEKILREICAKNGININDRYIGIIQISRILLNNEIISKEDFSIIREVIGILNRAVHSNLTKSDIESYNLVIKYCVALINTLKSKL